MKTLINRAMKCRYTNPPPCFLFFAARQTVTAYGMANVSNKERKQCVGQRSLRCQQGRADYYGSGASLTDLYDRVNAFLQNCCVSGKGTGVQTHPLSFPEKPCPVDAIKVGFLFPKGDCCHGPTRHIGLFISCL